MPWTWTSGRISRVAAPPLYRLTPPLPPLSLQSCSLAPPPETMFTNQTQGCHTNVHICLLYSRFCSHFLYTCTTKPAAAEAAIAAIWTFLPLFWCLPSRISRALARPAGHTLVSTVKRAPAKNARGQHCPCRGLPRSHAGKYVSHTCGSRNGMVGFAVRISRRVGSIIPASPNASTGTCEHCVRLLASSLGQKNRNVKHFSA